MLPQQMNPQGMPQMQSPWMGMPAQQQMPVDPTLMQMQAQGMPMYAQNNVSPEQQATAESIRQQFKTPPAPTMPPQMTPPPEKYPGFGSKITSGLKKIKER